MCQSFPLLRRHRFQLPRRLPRRLLHPRRPLHRFLHMLQSRRPHRQQGHHRLHRRRNPWLLSSQELVVNYTMRDMRRCPGGHVAIPVQCAMLHGNTPIAMACCRPWIMQHWCRCWLPGNHSPANESPDRLTAPVSEIHTPTSVYEAETSPYADICVTACYKPVLLHR